MSQASQLLEPQSLRGCPHFAREIARWLNPAPDAELDGLQLARMVTVAVRRSGRHLLDEDLLAALAEIQRRYRGRDPYLDAFLDAILARRQDRFRNQTYLALPLLQLILADESSELDPERLSALLVADIVRHESHAGGSDRPDQATQRKRVQHATRLLSAIDPGATDLPAAPQTRAAEWLALTAQPVSVVHDEYFFIRALQTHELVFTTLTAELRRATCAIRRGRIRIATAAVRRANEVFQRAAMLFRLVATMRAEHFHAFRVFTDGASAIQSEAYKRFEIACGRPSAARLGSDAFTNVPAVQAEAPKQDNLVAAYRDLCLLGGVDTAVGGDLDAALAELEASHQRWKTTHHRLAAKMLGEARGSGYTAGVPYLRQCLDNRLFTPATAGMCQRMAS